MKKTYIKPETVLFSYGNDELLAGSPPPEQIGPEGGKDGEKTEFGGEFEGAGAKGTNTIWDDNWD